MAKIKIRDLSKNRKIGKKEMKQLLGGFNPQPEPPARFGSFMNYMNFGVTRKSYY